MNIKEFLMNNKLLVSTVVAVILYVIFGTNVVLPKVEDSTKIEVDSANSKIDTSIIKLDSI